VLASWLPPCPPSAQDLSLPGSWRAPTSISCSNPTSCPGRVYRAETTPMPLSLASVSTPAVQVLWADESSGMVHLSAAQLVQASRPELLHYGCVEGSACIKDSNHRGTGRIRGPGWCPGHWPSHQYHPSCVPIPPGAWLCTAQLWAVLCTGGM
jgi:hypothetical protein